MKHQTLGSGSHSSSSSSSLKAPGSWALTVLLVFHLDRWCILHPAGKAPMLAMLH
jgi:hypothetical protein